MCRSCLWIATIRLHLHSVDEIGKLDGVLDEENRNVVANQIPVALTGVEFHREATHVARRVDRPGAAGDRGELSKHRSLSPFRNNAALDRSEMSSVASK